MSSDLYKLNEDATALDTRGGVYRILEGVVVKVIDKNSTWYTVEYENKIYKIQRESLDPYISSSSSYTSSVSISPGEMVGGALFLTGLALIL
ncbi:MAG: hypothetical protein EZS28_055020 [Streblomastix strix]|uniref:SH3 domain-containing protein n=1 Tax=Streblomastix strix TaxID=222440 RepID=A0A5J4QAI4_9EUKA|nr:MAG: hypothetical protein EZS28_055020 [Streblomastix strix]